MFGKVKRLERRIHELERLVHSHRDDYWETQSKISRLMDYLEVYDKKVEEHSFMEKRKQPEV